MLSCKEATRLLTEKLDRPLSFSERLALGVHLAMCRGCTHFERQMGFLRVACHRYVQRISGDEAGKE